ncbi:MAG: iron-sulfur cluster repair di-iron protein [Gemmatimonadota bacterium]
MISTTDTVKDIVVAHPLATRVFQRHSIDFCCRGGIALSEACDKKGLDADRIAKEVEAEIAGTGDDAARWEERPLDELIDHILTTYHEALRSELPRLQQMARKVLAVHGDKMPEVLPELHRVFSDLQTELESHMAKEEEILFPMIRAGHGENAGAPITVMEHEHASAGAALERLRELTNDYQPPADACATWTGLWAGLADLEKELHLHIHLENNILFPRAMEEHAPVH